MRASKFIDKLASKNQLIKYVPKPLQGKLRKENYWEPC